MADPVSGKPVFFSSQALPFGAASAVHSFNRAAAALNHLLHRYLGLPCTNYFDDFTFIAPTAIAETIEDLASRFFKLLGWEVKEEKGTIRFNAAPCGQHKNRPVLLLAKSTTS